MTVNEFIFNNLSQQKCLKWKAQKRFTDVTVDYM